eukprot:gene14788-20838_t
MGTYNEQGIIMPSCNSITFQSKELIYENVDCGIETHYLHFLTDRGFTWEAALKRYNKEKEEDPNTFSCFAFHANVRSGKRTYVLAIERNERGRRIKNQKGKKKPAYFKIIRPCTGFAPGDTPYKEFNRDWEPLPDSEVDDDLKGRWNEELRKGEKKRYQNLHLLCGSILPLLPTIDLVIMTKSRTQLKVMRVESTAGTSDGQLVTAVGVQVQENLLGPMLKAIKDRPDNKLPPSVDASKRPNLGGVIQIKADPSQVKDPSQVVDLSHDCSGAASSSKRASQHSRTQPGIDVATEVVFAALASAGLWAAPDASILIPKEVRNDGVVGGNGGAGKKGAVRKPPPPAALAMTASPKAPRLPLSRMPSTAGLSTGLAANTSHPGRVTPSVSESCIVIDEDDESSAAAPKLDRLPAEDGASLDDDGDELPVLRETSHTGRVTEPKFQAGESGKRSGSVNPTGLGRALDTAKTDAGDGAAGPSGVGRAKGSGAEEGAVADEAPAAGKTSRAGQKPKRPGSLSSLDSGGGLGSSGADSDNDDTPLFMLKTKKRHLTARLDNMAETAQEEKSRPSSNAKAGGHTPLSSNPGKENMPPACYKSAARTATACAAASTKASSTMNAKRAADEENMHNGSHAAKKLSRQEKAASSSAPATYMEPPSKTDTHCVKKRIKPSTPCPSELPPLVSKIQLITQDLITPSVTCNAFALATKPRISTRATENY